MRGEAGWPYAAVGNARVGAALSGLGDLDGDGIADLAIGSTGGGSGGRGAVDIVMLNASGAVRSLRQVGYPQLPIDAADAFGSAVASVADLDGDAMPDEVASPVGGANSTMLAVGAPGDSGEAGGSTGAVYLLFLSQTTGGGGIADFAVRPDYARLSNRSANAIGAGGAAADIPIALGAGARFGTSVALRTLPAGGGPAGGGGGGAAPLPAGVTMVELAAGASGEGDGMGAVYLVLLKVVTTQQRHLPPLSGGGSGSSSVGQSGGGTVSSLITLMATRRLVPVVGGSSSSHGGLLAPLPSFALFGSSVSWLPEAGCCVHRPPSLAVGAPGVDGSGLNGTVYLLNAESGEAAGVPIQSPNAQSSPHAQFGLSLAVGPDWDGNGKRELLVGAPNEPGGGAAYVIFRGGQGDDDVREHVRLVPTSVIERLREPTQSAAATAGVAGAIGSGGARFGDSVAVVGKVDGDLVPDVALGAPRFGSGVLGSGAVFTALLSEAAYQWPPMLPPAPPSPPPPSLSPPLPPGAQTVYAVTFTTTIAETLESFDKEKQQRFRVGLASKLEGVRAEDIQLLVQPASIVVKVIISTPSPTASSVTSEALRQYDEAMFTEVLGVTVTSVSAVTQEVIVREAAPPSPPLALPPRPPTSPTLGVKANVETISFALSGTITIVLVVALATCTLLLVRHMRKRGQLRPEREFIHWVWHAPDRLREGLRMTSISVSLSGSTRMQFNKPEAKEMRATARTTPPPGLTQPPPQQPPQQSRPQPPPPPPPQQQQLGGSRWAGLASATAASASPAPRPAERDERVPEGDTGGGVLFYAANYIDPSPREDEA